MNYVIIYLYIQLNLFKIFKNFKSIWSFIYFFLSHI